jgi:methionyl-tRNA formyltransferase
MLDTIILLTGAVEQPVLGSILRSHNPALRIETVSSPAEVAALQPDLLRRARLIAFCTDVVVPPRVLDQVGFGAYNFHPASPRFPGWGCAHFAIHEGAREFGATAHVMLEKVDAGPIVGVELFDVPAGAQASDLEALAYVSLAQMFRRLAPALVQSAPLAPLPIKWSGVKGTRRRYAASCAESIPASKERAFS